MRPKTNRKQVVTAPVPLTGVRKVSGSQSRSSRSQSRSRLRLLSEKASKHDDHRRGNSFTRVKEGSERSTSSKTTKGDKEKKSTRMSDEKYKSLPRNRSHSVTIRLPASKTDESNGEEVRSKHSDISSQKSQRKSRSPNRRFCSTRSRILASSKSSESHSRRRGQRSSFSESEERHSKRKD